MKEKTILYIVSDIRSGSTLLENILSKSNEVVSVGELHHLDSYIHKGQVGATSGWICTCGQSFTDCNFWNSVKNEMKLSSIKDIKNTTINYVRNPDEDELSKQQETLILLEQIYKAVFKVSKAHVIVDSSK